ncbi:MAG: nucleotidyltransferase family protein [Smithella sp.]|jgi:hypothetical protein
MKDFKYPKSFPNKEEELFLQLLLSSKDDFPELWRQWKEQIVFDRLDNATSKLIPFLYLRLKALNIEDGEIKRIKGAHKHTWYKNLLVMDSARNVVSLFNKENIPVILLKGVPLLANAYQNTGARSVGDADILIDPRHVEKAVEIMNADGWEYRYQSPFSKNRISNPLANKYIKEITFINDQNIQIDMHWSIFSFSFNENKEHPMSYEEVFKHSVDCNLKGIKCKMPCNEDMLIHVIVHGAEQVFQRTLRWVLDAATLIKNTPIDWEFLIKRIKQFDVAVELNVAFSYLVKNYSLPVPESFIKKLSGLPMKKNKIKEYYRITNNTEFILFGKILYLWRGYWLYERNGNLFTSWYYFIDYACKNLGIKNKRQIPAFIMEKYKQRMSVLFNKS